MSVQDIAISKDMGMKRNCEGQHGPKTRMEIASCSCTCICITNHFFSLTDTAASASAILLHRMDMLAHACGHTSVLEAAGFPHQARLG